MEKRKMQKGITLIALIITIVVLLILAVVTINAIKDGGIITYAQNAANDYTIAQEKEQIALGYSEYIINKNISDNAELKVEGAQVTGSEENGWEVVFNETNHKYQVDKNGNITYVESEEDKNEENPSEEDALPERIIAYIGQSASAILDIPGYVEITKNESGEITGGGYYPLVDDQDAKAYVTKVSSAIIEIDGINYVFVVNSVTLEIIDVFEKKDYVTTTIDGNNVLKNLDELEYVVPQEDGELSYSYAFDVDLSTCKTDGMLYVSDLVLREDITGILVNNNIKNKNLEDFDDRIKYYYVPTDINYIGKIGYVKFIENGDPIDSSGTEGYLTKKMIGDEEYYVISMELYEK